MSNQAFDDNGNEIFLITANIVVPTNHHKDAAVLASEYMRDVEQVTDWQPEKMMPTKLSSNGKTISHHICSRVVYTNQIAMMANAIKEHSKKHKWCAQYCYELDEEKLMGVENVFDNKEKKVEKEQKELLKEILNSFCVVCCPLEHFLEFTGLERIG